MSLFRRRPVDVSGNRNYLISIHFSLPGNTRWDCPIIYRNPGLAGRVEALLHEQSGLLSITANPNTGRLRVLYSARLSEELVAGLCEAAIQDAVQAPGSEPSPPPRKFAAQSDNQEESIWPVVAGMALGLGAIGVWLVARAAAKVFPRRAVWAGVVAFVGSSAVLGYLLSRESADRRIQVNRNRALRELAKISRPYRLQLSIGLTLVVLSRVLQVAAIAIVGVIIDVMMAPGNISLFGWAIATQGISVPWLGVTAALLIAACALCDYLSRIIWMRAAHSISHNLRLDLYSHLQNLDMQQISDTNRGVYVTLLNDDINRIELLFGSVWGVSREVSYGACSILSFFIINPAFAGMVAVPLSGLLILSYSLEKRTRPRYAALREQAGDLSGLLTSTLDGVETTRAFAQETQTRNWVDRASELYRAEQDATLQIVTAYDPAVLAAANGLRVATSIAAGFYAAAGMMSIGTYVTLVTLATSLALPLRGIARDFPHILSTLASLSRVFEAFELHVEDRSAGLPLTSDGARGAIRFERVNLAYVPGQPVLQDFSVLIPEGRVTAFVGKTGSGKSTIAKLLLRFYDPDGGRITLDKENIVNLDRLDVRRNIGYVGQDIFLFGGTIRDNIAFAEPEIGEEAVIEAAHVAGAHDFIAEMPDGYNTTAGERGQKLSGGERQRVGIARALLLHKPIIILDEATSSLDSVTETNLLNSLTDALAGRTVILIAHRLSAVRNAHRIHVLEQGSIVEAGTHNELLEQGGRYARFWALQTDDSADLE